MLVVGGAFLDPSVEEILLLLTEGHLGFWRRHDLALVVRADEEMQVAFFQIPRDDAEESAEVGDGMFTGIEAEVGLLVFRIRALPDVLCE